MIAFVPVFVLPVKLVPGLFLVGERVVGTGASKKKKKEEHSAEAKKGEQLTVVGGCCHSFCGVCC